MTFYNEIKKWPLMGSVWTPLIIIAFYVLAVFIVKRIGKDENTRWGMIVFKYFMLVMAVLNWLLSIFFWCMWIKLKYSFFCEPASQLHRRHRQYQSAPVYSSQRWSWWWIWITGHDLENDLKLKEAEIRVAKGLWVYLISKMAECFDQILLAVQDRDLPIEDLVHHVIMVLITWIGLRLAPGGSTIIWATINTTFLSVSFTFQTTKRFMRGYGYTNDIMWSRMKFYVTSVKVFHFVISGIHGLTILLSRPSTCDFPKSFAFILLIFCAFMTYITIPEIFPGAFGGGPPPGLAFLGLRLRRSGDGNDDKANNVASPNAAPFDDQNQNENANFLRSFNRNLSSFNPINGPVPQSFEGYFVQRRRRRRLLIAHGQELYGATIPQERYKPGKPFPW